MTKKTNNTTTFQALISQIQREIRAKKTGINKFSGFQYYTLEDLQGALKPLLPEGVFLIFKIFPTELWGKPAVEAVATLTDGENLVSTNAIVFVDTNKEGMSPEQVMGAAITYAKKYALASLLLLDDGAEDPDNTSGSEKEQGKPAKKEVKKESPADVKPQQDLIDKFIELTSKAQTLEEFNNLKKEFIKKYGSRLNPATTQELKKYVQEVVQAFQSA